MGTYRQLLFHVIFSTQNQLPTLTDSVRKFVLSHMQSAICEMKSMPHKLGGDVDHVHLLVDMPVDISIHDFVARIKARATMTIPSSGGRLRAVKWQNGYAAFTVSGQVAAKVGRYIGRQKRHHREESFKDEYIRLLEEHEIEYDTETLWE